MIIRENARLFFLSALSSNAKCEDMIRASDFGFRLARRSDIESIRHCNLETLPENYSSEFYDNHIRDWPELALVAEHADRQNEDHPPKVVGYVLGKMEGSKDDHTAETQNQLNTAIPGWSTRGPRNRVLSPSSSSSCSGGLSIPRTGHVTSLAVLPGYRRCGAAKQLMDMLHDRMTYHYKATKVSLHVRKSNRGAIRLYEELLGYKVAGVASAYYSDGEDAFVMEAELPALDTQPAAGITGTPATPPSSATINRNNKGFVTAATAAASAGGDGGDSSNRRHGGAGLVTAAATHGAPYYPPPRNNVGFVTAAAAAAAATVASATTTTTEAAETAAGAAPPLVLQAVVSTPGRSGSGSGSNGGGGVGRKGSKGIYARFLGGGGRRDGS